MTECTKPTPYSKGKNAHWFVFETAEGRHSKGYCRNCGATTEGQNSIDVSKQFSYQSHKDQQARPVNDI